MYSDQPRGYSVITRHPMDLYRGGVTVGEANKLEKPEAVEKEVQQDKDQEAQQKADSRPAKTIVVV